MTANPVKPARYRPGKPTAEVPSSEEEEDSDIEAGDDVNEEPQPTTTTSTLPSDSTRIASNLKKVDLNARRKQAAANEAARLEAEKVIRDKEEEGFVTEESDEEAEGSESEASESEEESSSEDEAPKVLLRPTFIRKEKRNEVIAVDTKTEDEKWAEEEARRKEKADVLVQEQLEKNAAARAAGKKYWDDDEDVDGDIVDDTDGLDPDAEFAAWKLRELKRVKREREAIETAEKEREEVERRRNLSKEEREAEDKDFIDRQKEEQDGKGKMGFLQKYYHKGAFFQDDAKAEGLDRRDIMASRYQDDVKNREALPEYMQIRDMTRLGRKGRTKYKDLKSEDTGKWGTFDGRGPRRGDGTLDERFMPDRDGVRGASGANATVVRERRKAPEGAPEGPRAVNQRDTGGRGDTYIPSRDEGERRSDSERRRRRSYSRSRSRSPRRDRRREDRDRRKRSPSPYVDRYDSDKRRRIDAT